MAAKKRTDNRALKAVSPLGKANPLATDSATFFSDLLEINRWSFPVESCTGKLQTYGGCDLVAFLDTSFFELLCMFWEAFCRNLNDNWLFTIIMYLPVHIISMFNNWLFIGFANQQIF